MLPATGLVVYSLSKAQAYEHPMKEPRIEVMGKAGLMLQYYEPPAKPQQQVSSLPNAEHGIEQKV